MAIIPQKRLFTWKDIDAASDLDRLRLVLSVLPDEALMRRLEKRRGKGRDDYPVRATWNAVIAGIVFQHPSTASLPDDKKMQQEDRRRDPDADKGVKTYRGTREDGTTWQKVKTWFGYKLHLLVDSVFEMPLAFKVTEASGGDSPELMPLVETLETNHPALSQRARELSADRAYDSRENKRRLFDEYGIKPLIDMRTCWKTPGETRPLVPDRADFFVYDERGNLLRSFLAPVRSKAG